MNASRIALAFAVGVVVAAGALRAAAESNVELAQEPPLRLVLHLDDRAVELAAGRTDRIDLPGGEARVRVELLPDRRLDLAYVAFDYPAYFDFTHRSPSPNADRWTVGGDGVQVSVDRIAGGIDADTYREQVRSTGERVLADSLLKTEPISQELGGRILTGFRHTTRHNVGQIEQTMLFDYLFFTHQGQTGCLLMVYPADAAGPDGAHTRVRRQIADSWAWQEPKPQPEPGDAEPANAP
ncbi:MAG: hypothetical protein AAGF84_03140 [Planctomycetota bacterium]